MHLGMYRARDQTETLGLGLSWSRSVSVSVCLGLGRLDLGLSRSRSSRSRSVSVSVVSARLSVCLGLIYSLNHPHSDSVSTVISEVKTGIVRSQDTLRMKKY